jgi:hypothetical protein
MNNRIAFATKKYVIPLENIAHIASYYRAPFKQGESEVTDYVLVAMKNSQHALTLTAEEGRQLIAAFADYSTIICATYTQGN